MYYPKSQINPNLYTNGGEYVLINTEKNYIGFYYEISTGGKYTGKNPTSGANIKLVPQQSNPKSPKGTLLQQSKIVGVANFNSDPDPVLMGNAEDTIYSLQPRNPSNSSFYTSIQKTNTPDRFLPQPYFSKPTTKEIGIGEYRRYFVKKTNELIYIEISKETYTKFKAKDSKVAWDLYDCLFVPWSLNSETTNRNILALVEKDNKWYGFSSYFKDYFGPPRN